MLSLNLDFATYVCNLIKWRQSSWIEIDWSTFTNSQFCLVHITWENNERQMEKKNQVEQNKTRNRQQKSVTMWMCEQKTLFEKEVKFIVVYETQV